MSSSSAKTSSSQQQSTTTTNLNLQDTAGVTVVGNTGLTTVNSSTTDYGAINAAADFASRAAGAASDISGAAISLGKSGLDAGVSVANGGLDLAAQAIGSAGQSADRVSRFATDAIDQNSDLAKQLSGSAISGILDAGSGVLQFAQQLFSQALAANSNATQADIAGVNTLANQVSQSSQQSVNDAVVKLATIAAIAIAAIYIFKR